MRNLSIPKLAASIGVCLAAGIVGSFFTISSIPTWYVTLNKPTFTPPNWIFGPVWTTLYILMGISFYIVWHHGIKHKSVDRAFIFFGLQLIFNTVWSIIFFGLKSPVLGLIDIVALWLVLIVTLILFRKISRLSFYLLIPYFLWVSFAAILNFMIVVLN